MKKSEVKHVTDLKDIDSDDPELVFTHLVRDDQTFVKSSSGPESWDNVFHLTGHLFYAYENGHADDGCVYLGEYVTK